MVRPIRFERMTYGLEGRCSIQLSYGRKKLCSKSRLVTLYKILVGVEGLEPPTLWSQTRYATKLRYTPKKAQLYFDSLPSQCLIHSRCYQFWQLLHHSSQWGRPILCRSLQDACLWRQYPSLSQAQRRGRQSLNSRLACC